MPGDIGILSMTISMQLCPANSYSDAASPSLESIEDEKYFAKTSPKCCRGIGSSTDLTACILNIRATVTFRIRIASPVGGRPNIPDTITASPGFAPLLTGNLPLAKPIILQSMTSSPASLVSPPSIFTPNSFEAVAKPLASPWMYDRVQFFGRPSDIIAACGLMPFETKSLMHDTTLFRATCQASIPGGTSVLATSMSLLNTMQLPTIATSSSSLIPSILANMPMISFSVNSYTHTTYSINTILFSLRF